LVTEYVNPDTSSPGAVNRQFNHKLTVDMDCDDYNDDDDVIMSGDTGYPSRVLYVYIHAHVNVYVFCVDLYSEQKYLLYWNLINK